jgi:hypothetical protein
VRPSGLMSYWPEGRLQDGFRAMYTRAPSKEERPTAPRPPLGATLGPIEVTLGLSRIVS